jgi:hypothetical protein
MLLGLYTFTDTTADGALRLDVAAGEEVVCVERADDLALGSHALEPPWTLFLTTR